MMAKQDDNQGEKIEGNPFDLAMIVSDRIELETVLILESQTWRQPSLDLPDEPPDFELGIEHTAHGKNVEEKKIYVKLGFISRDTGSSNAEPSIYSVKATFVLVYRITSFEGVEDHNIWAFSMTTGIYNAWPYWREFLQSTTVRMGLPPVVAPPFRFASKEAEN